MITPLTIRKQAFYKAFSGSVPGLCAPQSPAHERATKFIAENATKGIGPQEVADSLGVSRTLLGLREADVKAVVMFGR